MLSKNKLLKQRKKGEYFHFSYKVLKKIPFCHLRCGTPR